MSAVPGDTEQAGEVGTEAVARRFGLSESVLGIPPPFQIDGDLSGEAGEVGTGAVARGSLLLDAGPSAHPDAGMLEVVTGRSAALDVRSSSSLDGARLPSFEGALEGGVRVGGAALDVRLIASAGSAEEVRSKTAVVERENTPDGRRQRAAHAGVLAPGVARAVGEAMGVEVEGVKGVEGRRFMGASRTASSSVASVLRRRSP